jgi:hypothetical protein
MNIFKRKNKKPQISFTDDFVGQLHLGPSQKPTKIDYTYNRELNKLQVFVDGELVEFL